MENKHGIEINDEIIVKYLTGEASPDEALALHDWLSVSENQSYFEGFQHTWNNTHPLMKPAVQSTKQAWQELSTMLDATDIPIRSWFQLSPFILKIAASVLIVFTFSIFLFNFLQREQPIPEITIRSDGNSKTITLPDSSKVVLYRHSSISYYGNFGLLNREINFSGEGFFRVKGNVGKPFIIHTSLADIKVVGTVFHVSLDAEKLDVSVEEGKVMVFSKTDRAVLKPGHAAAVRGAMESISVRNTVDINNWAYATHKFQFQDTPLDQVFQQIEKAYPYVIEVKNENIKNCKLTATFDQVSAAEILNLIGETLDLTIKENDNAFYIEGKGCPWDQ